MNVFDGNKPNCPHPFVQRCSMPENRWECSDPECHARFMPIGEVFDQVEQGLIAQHDCPAVYACAAILCDCIEGNEPEEDKQLGVTHDG